MQNGMVNYETPPDAATATLLEAEEIVPIRSLCHTNDHAHHQLCTNKTIDNGSIDVLISTCFQ